MGALVSDERLHPQGRHPAVDETTKLKERSKKNYQKVLQYVASELEDYAIESAVRPRILEEAFRKIALEHGTATARQAVKVTSKYVMERLVRDEAILFNPLRDFTPDLPNHVAAIGSPEAGIDP